MPSPAESIALSIVQRLQSAGHIAYFAGGCVRDRVMGREPKDFDVATSAVPDQVIALFPRSQQVGVSFGVMLVRERRTDKLIQIEVATFRADSTYSDGRHPDSVRYTTAQEDALRRDFTCNGLFLDPLAKTAEGGELHDFVGGLQDIRDKILRAIGDPYRRFAEDHLRLLRAIRFPGKLGFTIEPATWDAIRKLAPQIAGISRERIAGELRLILTHPSRALAMKLLQESLLLENFWPAELFPQPQLPRQWRRLSHLPREATFAAALVAVHRDLCLLEGPNPAGNLIASDQAAHLLQERLALSNQEMEDFLWLDRQLSTTLHAVENKLELLRISALKRLLADPRWEDLLLLIRADRNDPARDAIEDALFAKMREQGVAPRAFIMGDALIRLGATPGPQFKRWLDELYDRQLEGEFATEQDAIAAARQLIHP